jgi:two-component system chemotaxis sensor kinase CheA
VSPDPRDPRGRVDFADEAMERLETIHSILDSGREPRISEINETFRAVHSLKGLAGLAGLERFGKALHEAENLLDNLRLSKLAWGPRVRESLANFFFSLETALPAAAEKRSDAGFDPDRAVALLSQARETGEVPALRPLTLDLELPEHTIGCLSEYEESRLRANLSRGASIFAVDASFELDAFEEGLKALGARLNEAGEWIATLPQVSGFTAERLAVQLLAAAPSEPSGLGEGIAVRRVSRAPAAPPEVESIRAPAGKTVRLETARVEKLLAEAEEARAAFQKLSFDLQRLEAELPPSRRVRLSSGRERLSASLARLTGLAAAARTMPVSALASRLERAASRLLESSGKLAKFRVHGGEVEIDRALAEDLADPLLHLLRNAVDHGIETREKRRAAGKPEEAAITFTAQARGPRISLALSDDGRGIDEEGVLRRARTLGWIAEGAELTREELFKVLFRPGFSTAAQVSEVSGRGVGLDVVAERAAARQGEVVVESTPGRGARFEIVVPVSQAVFDALVVRDSGKLYAFPLASIARVEREAGGEPSEPLCRAIGLESAPAEGPRLRVVLPDERSLSVEAVLRQEMLVVRPIGSRSRIPYLIGVSEGEGEEAILVFDPKRLLRESARSAAAR